MAQGNAEVVRELIDAANKGDVDGLVACLQPDVEWIEAGDVLPGLRGIYHGREEVREWFRDAFVEPWDGRAQFQIEEVVEAPDDLVFLQLHISAHGRVSGARVEIRAWNVASFEGGLVQRRQIFWTRGEALEAAGLSE
jgi:ketosteroid isomerase-like protein